MLCFDHDGAIDRDRFAGDVAALRPAIAWASHFCNLAADRYDFMVGLAAALLNGQRVVLPTADASEAIAAVLAEAETPLLFRTRPACPPSRGDGVALMAELAASEAVIEVFTSGSTGAPKRQRKTWRMLAVGAEVTTEILRRCGLEPTRCGILGATPHQHMFGLESALFAGLALGWPLHRGRIFYPADIASAVADARLCGLDSLALSVSPVHLRHLEPALMETPEIRAIVSATAPLPRSLAERLEARGDLAVMEIYGSSETGSISLRRTARDELWEPVAGFTLRVEEGRTFAMAPHLPGPTPVGDLVEIEADSRFRLLGRDADMISVAGKRASRGALTEALLEVEGVIDGVVLHEASESRDWIGVAIVRDPAILPDDAAAKAAIRKRFLRRFDAAMAPRRVVAVERLPRNDIGKIPAVELDALRDRLRVGEA
ncbi:MAG: AMP-binding protein [Pikeienuella sp.]